MIIFSLGRRLPKKLGDDPVEVIKDKIFKSGVDQERAKAKAAAASPAAAFAASVAASAAAATAAAADNADMNY